MGVWAWVQLDDRIWKVVSDNIRGILTVYDENGVKIFERTGLSKKALEIIEANFLNVVATKISGEKSGEDYIMEMEKTLPEYNPMYI
jgi:hypothetical protein